MEFVKILEGQGPVILTQPHGGTYIPENFINHFNERGLRMADTDWHINRLYKGLLKSATVVQAIFSRYIIDVNRSPNGYHLYPGKNTTELCPTIDFSGEPIYKSGMEPDLEEIEKRKKNFHYLYHNAISEQLMRVKQKHGRVLIFDCHSIRSKIPFLFDGKLPHLNLGTNNNTTCGKNIEKVAVDVCSKSFGYKFVLNGRFKGGWTTRHYGNPKKGIHAIQLELAQRTYLEEIRPRDYVFEKASNIRILLKNLLNCLEKSLE